MMRQRHLPLTWTRWLPLLLTLLSLPGFSAPLIKLDADFTSTNLENYVDLLADPSQQLGIAQVAQGTAADDFTPANHTKLQNTDERSAYWLRFGIDNPQQDAFVLALDVRAPEEVAVQAFDTSMKPLTVHRAPLLQLFIPPHSKQLYYLRIEPDKLRLMQLELLRFENYVAIYRAQSWRNGLYQGAILLVAVVAAVAGLIRRDAAYLWLTGYSLALTSFLLVFCADASPYLFDHIPYWQHRNLALQVVLLLSVLFSIKIASRVLTQPTGNRYEKRTLDILSACTVIAIPVALVLQSHAGAALALTMLTASIAATIFIALSNYLRTHQRELILYAVARVPILLLAIGGSFAWRTNRSLRDVTDSILPIVMTIDVASVFLILLNRSFDRQREHARNERNIAVLEAEARSRTEVVAEVGHRVRTPVSGVLGMLDMLQDTSLSATQFDYLSTIRRASNELLNAIDEISDVNRLQAHTSQLQQNIFDPHALISECVDGFRSAAAAHRLELISDIAPELSAYVSGDSTRLRQIILQLLHQAVSRHERGEIVLRVYQKQHDWLHVDIQTNASIAESTPSEIDRRVNPPGSANVRFAIARQLIDLLGGHIQIADRTDGNLHAHFDLELPTVERDAPSAARDTRLQGRHLLVIDDNITLCNVLERQLKHWGMTVYIAQSASEGVARLRNQITLSQPIDVLLIDIDLPDLQQSDWLQRLHSEVSPAPIVICLSSDPAREIASRPVDSLRTLLKPINHTSLKITLIEAFKQREQREQRPQPTPPLRNATIRCLFAEDNLINAKVLAGMLDKLGVIYTAVNNGQEAVDACRRDRFDIVLMDWDMPVMDGWEAARRIRDMFESRGLPPMPIIALTANTVEELGERARQPVMDAHLVKPIQLQRLRELLEQWTGKLVMAADKPAN